MKLKDLRTEIDAIDEKILLQLAARMKLVKNIKDVKKTLQLSVTDKKRERELMKNLVQKGDRLGLAASFIGKLYRLIVKESKRIQKKE